MRHVHGLPSPLTLSWAFSNSGPDADYPNIEHALTPDARPWTRQIRGYGLKPRPPEESAIAGGRQSETALMRIVLLTVLAEV